MSKIGNFFSQINRDKSLILLGPALQDYAGSP